MNALHIPSVHTTIAEHLELADIHRMTEVARHVQSIGLDDLRVLHLRLLRARLRRQHVVLLQRVASLELRLDDIGDRIDHLS